MCSLSILCAAFAPLSSLSTETYSAPGVPPAATVQATTEGSLIEVISRDAENKGEVALGQRVERQVVVRNISDSRIRIAIVNKSCDCLNPKAQPETLAPGEASLLSFEMTAVGAPDRQRLSATFRATADPAGEPPTRYTQDIIAGLSYSTRFEYVVLPKRLVLTVVQGRPFEAAAFVQMPESANLRAEPGLSPWPVVTIDPKGTPAIQDGNAVWEIRIRGTFNEIGPVDGLLRIPVLGASTGAEVPTFIRVLPAWRTSPAGVAIDLTSIHRPRIVRLALHRSDREDTIAAPARIRVHPNLRGIRAELRQDDEQQAAVLVTIDPAAPGPAVSAIELLDRDGTVVGKIPVALYRRSADNP